MGKRFLLMMAFALLWSAACGGVPLRPAPVALPAEGPFGYIADQGVLNHPERVVFVADTRTTRGDRVISFQAFDVNDPDELLVLANGTEVALLGTGTSEGVWSDTIDVVVAADVVGASGQTRLEIVNIYNGGGELRTWGVRQVSLAGQLPLAGVLRGGAKGADVLVTFQAAEGDGLLRFQSRGTEPDQRIEVRLNGLHLAELASNSTKAEWTPTFSLSLSRDRVHFGELNVLAFGLAGSRLDGEPFEIRDIAVGAESGQNDAADGGEIRSETEAAGVLPAPPKTEPERPSMARDAVARPEEGPPEPTPGLRGVPIPGQADRETAATDAGEARGVPPSAAAAVPGEGAVVEPSRPTGRAALPPGTERARPAARMDGSSEVPDPQPRVGSARMVVNSDPEGALVYLGTSYTSNGKFLGWTPVQIEQAPSGAHVVTVAAPGFWPSRKYLLLEPGSDASLNVALMPMEVLDFDSPVQLVSASPANLAENSYLTPTLGDLNRDGILDVVCGNAAGTLLAYLNGAPFGPPSLSGEPRRVWAGGEPISVGRYSAPALVDWNGDGAGDILVGDGGGKVWFFKGAERGGGFESGTLLLCGGKPIDVGNCAFPLVADVNGDGLDDLLVGSGYGTLKLFLATGRFGAGLAEGPEVLAGGQPLQFPLNLVPFDFADWTGDGRPDLMVAGMYGALFLLEGLAKPNEFGSPRALSAGNEQLFNGTYACPVAFDWNGDGRKDILLANYAGEIWVVLSREGSGGRLPSAGRPEPPEIVRVPLERRIMRRFGVK